MSASVPSQAKPRRREAAIDPTALVLRDNVPEGCRVDLGEGLLRRFMVVFAEELEARPEVAALRRGRDAGSG